MEFRRATSEQVGDGAADDVDVGEVGRGMQVDRQADVVEHLGPQIALVSDRVVHDHDVGGDALALDGDDRIRDDTGDVVEAGRQEMLGELDVGVQARLEPANELGDVAATDDHRRVRLLDAEQRDVARVVDDCGPAGCVAGVRGVRRGAPHASVAASPRRSPLPLRAGRSSRRRAARRRAPR